MHWLKRLTGGVDEPVAETPQVATPNASRVIMLDPKTAGDWINVLEVDGTWIAKSYPSSEEAGNDPRIGVHTLRISAWQISNCDIDLDERISPEALRRAGLALKDQLDVVVPRLLMARPQMISCPRAPQVLPPIEGPIEIWCARQSFDPESPTMGEWTLRRLMPGPRVKFSLSCSNAREELPAQILAYQTAATSFLFLDGDWRTKTRIPLAVRQALAGVPMTGLRPGEICAAFRNTESRTTAWFLAATGKLHAWSTQSASPFFIDAESDDDRRCFTLQLDEIPVNADFARVLDPAWIARVGPAVAGRTLLEFLPYVPSGRTDDTPWNRVAIGLRDRAAERDLKALAEIAVASDPTFTGAQLQIVAHLPPNPTIGRVRFALNGYGAIGIEAPSNASNHRLALLLNLAARDIESWQIGADRTFTIAVDGAHTAHELMSATAKLADWWLENRKYLPESWYAVSPSGAPAWRPIVAELDAAAD